MTDPNMVQVQHVLREPVVVPGVRWWRFTPLPIPGPMCDTYMHTLMPPVIGDQLLLFVGPIDGRDQGVFGVRVLTREWRYSSWGSTNWPRGDAQSTVGPHLTCIVEECDSLYVGEEPSKGDDE